MAVYGNWIKDAVVAWLSGKTIKALLVNSTYVPDVDATTLTAITAAEVSGAGYTAGGVDITSLVSFSYDATLDRVKLACSADIAFGVVTLTDVSGIVYYVSGGKPIAVDLFGSLDVAGATFTYQRAPTGLLVITSPS